MLTQAVGWAAAAVLLVTMARQVWSQWQSGAVFVFTNSLLTLNAIAGLCIDRRSRRLQASRGGVCA